MAGDWRYLAYRLNGDDTETLLHPEVPLSDVQLTITLSGPDELTARIAPEIAGLVVDGKPVFEPWSTAIYAECDGHIRGGGILVGFEETDGYELKLDCAGFTAFAADEPFSGEYIAYQRDPLDIARYIWSWLQAPKGGGLNIKLDDTKTPVRLGIPENPELTERKATEAAAKKVYEGAKAARELWQKHVEESEEQAAKLEREVFAAAGIEYREKESKVLSQQSPPSGSNAAVYNLWLRERGTNEAHEDDGKLLSYRGMVDGKPDWRPISDARNAAAKAKVEALEAENKLTEARKKRVDEKRELESKAQEVYRRATDARQKIVGGEADPYVLAWYQTFDLGGELDELAANTPFDYRMSHYWEGETVGHTLLFGYPRLGRRRPDLRFMVGENVSVPPPIDYDGDDYADTVVVLGAGEGRKMVRGIATNMDTHRLRRTKVVEDKTIRSRAAAERLAESLLRRYTGELDIAQIRVRDHPHAPLGSYAVGDEIQVQTADGWTSDTALWVRILAITIEPQTGVATLETIRANKVGA